MTALFSGNLLDERNGRPIEGASLWVYAANGAEATLTDVMDQPLTQPLTTAVDGRFEYKTADGIYRHDFWKNSALIYRDNRVIVGTPAVVDVAVGTFGESLVASDTANTALSALSFSHSNTYSAGSVGDHLKRFVWVTDAPYNAKGDGVTDDRPACQAAIDAVKASGGGTVYFPQGVYLLNGVVGADGTLHGLLNTYGGANGDANRVFLAGQGKSSALKAGSNNMYIIRHSDSHSGVMDMTLDGDGRTGVVALAVVPESLSQTTQVVYQLYNKFTGIFYKSCAEAIMLRTGPDVAGVDSGCWYNEFSSSQVYFCTRGIWLRDCPVGSSGNNRNQFLNIRIGQGVNTAVDIHDGDTNTFIAVNAEGIQTGTSPNAVPTGFRIKQTGASGLDNNSNRFIGCTGEACTRYIENANPSTEFWGCPVGSANLFTAYPSVLTGGDASIQSYGLPRMYYSAGPVRVGYSVGYQYFEAENGTAIEQAGAYTFKGDEDTGLRRGAANRGQLFAGGLTKLEWNATGVGVGIEPDSLFQVAGGAGVGGFRVAISGTSQGYMDQDSFDFRTSGGSAIVAFKSTGTVFNTSLVTDAADDAAAAAAGVVVGEMYRTGSTLKIRLT